MSLRSLFTDPEWRTLQKTPVWAFLMTASADGNVDKKEIAAFTKELSEAFQYKDELAREVFASLFTDFTTVLPDCMTPPQEIVGYLRDVGKMLDTKAPTHAEAFKGAVLLICKNVAEASGSLLGSKISKDEMERMVLVAMALGVRVP